MVEDVHEVLFRLFLEVDLAFVVQHLFFVDVGVVVVSVWDSFGEPEDAVVEDGVLGG